MEFSTYYLWAGTVLLLLEFIHFYRQRKLSDQRTKLFYEMLGLSLVVCVGGILLTAELSGKMAGAWQARTITHMVYIAQFSLPFLLLRMACLVMHEPDSYCWKVGAVVWETGSAIILVNPWSGWISYLGEDGLLHVGSGYPIFVWGMVAFYLANLVIIFCKRKKMKRWQAIALVEAMLIMIMGILMQNLWRHSLTIGFAAALMLAVLYSTLHNPYAYVDFVPHVLNEDYFRYWIEEKLRENEDVFLLCIKLTGLQRIRMEYGTDQEVIRLAGKKLWDMTPGHAVFRVQYDRYIVLTKNDKEHRKLTDRVKALFTSEMNVDGCPIQCPVVMAEIEHAEEVCCRDSNELMNYVRFLTHQAEENHDLQCVSHSIESKKQFLYERSVEAYVKTALEEDLFEVWYQLVYSIPEQRFVSMEALSRLHHPELGWINPELFIRYATKNNQIFELMPCQVHRICRFLQRNREVLNGIRNVKINFSPEELRKKEYCEHLIDIIRSYNLPPEKFQFEVTETAATEYSEELKRCIQALQNTGISFCLDDFGSGYANFNSILRLPFDVIKMDRSLLFDITTSKKAAVFYQSMVETLHNIGYQIVAEGVETEQEAELLAKWNVDMIQGYYYAEPLPESEILKKLKMN